MKDVKVKNLTPGDIGTDVVLKGEVTHQEKVSDKNGRRYISVTINDGSGIIYANLFSGRQAKLYDEIKSIKNKSRCRIVGKVREVKNGDEGFNSIDITKIEIIQEPTVRQADKKEQAKKLNSILTQIENIGYKKLIKDVMSDIDINQFYIVPASERHYVYQGGLVDHIVRTAKIASAIIDTYDGKLNLDKDFMLTAILLFRVGKTKTLSFENGTTKVTEDGELFEDSLVTLDIVKKCLDTNDEISDYNKKLLLHVIAASKNKSVYGAVTIPKTVSPWLLYHIEMISLWLENFEAAEEKRIDNENIIYGPNNQVYILSEKSSDE